MITKFKIFEKMNLNDIKINVDNINQNLINKLTTELSIIKKKKKKRNLRPESITGFFKKESGLGKNIKIETKLDIHMTNNDLIEGIHIENEINNIEIIINEKTVYNLNNPIYTDDILIEKIPLFYKEYLKSNNWKINEIFKNI